MADNLVIFGHTYNNVAGFKATDTNNVEQTYEKTTLGTKSISSNGIYNASSDGLDGFSQVNVIVPNTYSAGDEGKVVDNGALVSQTSDTVTTNGTYDTTLINSLIVSVAGTGAKVETGEVTLSSDFSLSATPTVFPLQLSFVPDFFMLAMTNASWAAKSAPAGGLYEIIMVKKAYTPPMRQANSVSTDSFTGDYYKILAYNVTTTTDSATTNGYVLNGFTIVNNTYQSRFYFDNDGKLYVGRYSTASSKMFAGTYRYIAVKLP